ncbi:class I SAM-dependent methyltransferase [Candidatus Woesearchaeota archaeon]|nr:class I SAM-dependent methyltransferase [Candidatus Woesearchaeota archaeon]
MEKYIYEKIWERKKDKVVDYAKKGTRVYEASCLIQDCNKILDVGCGDGALYNIIKGRCKNYYGVDISKTALSQIKDKKVNMRVVNINEEKLPFQDNFFDYVVCLDVIEHVFDPIKLIEEIFRVTKKEGFVIISTPNIRYYKHILKLIFGRFPKTSGDPEHYDGGHLHYFTYKDIIEICSQKSSKIKKCGINTKFMIEFFSGGILIKAKKA